jgi:hypothetical protein
MEKLLEDEGNEWDEVEELEAEIEVLEEIEDEDDNKRTVSPTPDDSDSDEYLPAVEVQPFIFTTFAQTQTWAKSPSQRRAGSLVARKHRREDQARLIPPR